MALRQYRLSEPPSWPLRVLGVLGVGLAATVYVIVPNTVSGTTAPLVPALALEALFLFAVGVGLKTTPAELQDGIIAIVGAGAVVVLGYVVAQSLVADPFTHPLTRLLLSVMLGIVAVLVATIPAFGVHQFGGEEGDDGGLGSLE